MENFKWKEELKDSFKGFWADLWAFLCFDLAIAIIALTQTENQFEAILIFFLEKDWSIIAVIIIGIIGMSAIIDKLLRGVWWLLKFVLKGLIEH